MRARSESITDLPESPDDERQRRFRAYMWMMVARVACLGIFFIVPGWWKLAPALGAVFIPYFAVVIANQVVSRGGSRIAIPNALPTARSFSSAPQRPIPSDTVP